MSLFSCRLRLIQAAIYILAFAPCMYLLCRPVLAIQVVHEPTTSARYQRYIDDLMQKVDLNESGYIDKAEVEEFDYPIFENADTNGDALISAEEILQKVAGWQEDQELVLQAVSDVVEKTETSQSPDPLSIKLSAIILRLPRNFTQSQVLSLEKMYKKFAIATNNMADEAEGLGIHVLEQYELEATNEMPSRIGVSNEVVEHATSTRNRNGAGIQKVRNREFGSVFEVTPHISKDLTKLAVDFSGSYILTPEPGEKTDSSNVVSLTVQSMFVLKDKQATAVSMFSRGHHFLMILVADPIF